jgi:hypothetical protein
MIDEDDWERSYTALNRYSPIGRAGLVESWPAVIEPLTGFLLVRLAVGASETNFIAPSCPSRMGGFMRCGGIFVVI